MATAPIRQPPRRERLTESLVTSLVASHTGEATWIYDERLPGFVVRIVPGKASYYWYGRPKGKARPIRFHLGRHPAIPLAVARERAQQVAIGAAAGEDPQQKRREAIAADRQAVTLQHLWEQYRDDHLKPHCSPNTLRNDEVLYRDWLGPWGAKRAIRSITAEEVAELHRSISRQKWERKIGNKKTESVPCTNIADKAVKLLRRMLTFGRVNPNPAMNAVSFHGDGQRERYLSPDELERLMKALDKCPNQTVADYVRLAILTGARNSNVRNARWEQFNLDAGVWIIPKTQTKGRKKEKKPIAVNLMPEAIALLRARRSIVANDCPWVFPGGKEGKPIISPHKVWLKVLRGTGITDVKFHDLRHNLASWMAMSGASLLLIGQQLGHASKQSTARYAHLEAAAARPATAAALAAMLPKPKPDPK